MLQRLARPLMYAGIVGVVLALSKVHASRIADPPYDYTGTFRFAWSIAYILLLALTAYGTGLPDVVRTRRSALLSAIAAPWLAALAISVLQLVVGDALLPRFVVFGTALVLPVWFLGTVAIARGGEARAIDRDRVVVVTDRREAEALRTELAEGAERAAVVVATLEPGSLPSGGSTEQRPLVEAVEAHDATVLVLDREAQSDDALVSQAAELHEQGVRIRTLSLFYEQWLGKLPVAELERVSLLFDIGELHRARYARVKRLLDLGLGVLLLPVLVLLVPVVFLADLVGNRGPLFYVQPRVGRAGSTFRMFKFRTMAPGNVDVGEWTDRDDPRVTRFGGLLRRTHLDELPQILNVLAGDLSFVGPRPEQVHYVEELSRKLPFYDVRHLVRPGLTGWAQVKFPYGASEDDALEKLQYEFFYLRHQSLGFDLRILGRTVRSVVGLGGR